MALTHLALRHPGYAAYHAARAAAGGTVILDNSAYELADTLGSGLGAGPVLTAARLTGAAEVVCTDVPYDGPATITATRRFLAQAAETAGGLRFMAVPQGSTRAEWLACYDALTAMPGVHSIGISKLSVPRCWDAGIAPARLACVAELHQHGTPPKPLHLLGGDGCLPAELRAHRERGHCRRAQQRFLRRVLVRQVRHPAGPGQHRSWPGQHRPSPTWKPPGSRPPSSPRPAPASP